MKLRHFILLSICLLLLALPSFAQDTQTAEWGDLGLEVEFSEDWEADEDSDDALLVLFNGDLGIYFYTPWEDYDDAEEVAEIITDTDGFEFDDIIEIEVMGEEAFQVPYTSEDLSGFSVVFEFNGEVLVLDALVADDSLSSRDEETLMEVVDTIRPSEANSSGGGDTIESAADEDSTGEDIVDELIDLGLVGDDGDFLFEEDEVIDDTQLPESYEGGNIALGALISWEAVEDDEEDYRYCALAAQTSTDDYANEEGTSLIVALGSDNLGLIAEFDLEDSDNSLFGDFDADIDVEDQNHLLMIVSDDELSVFVNGEQVVEGWELDITAGDDELFAGFFSDLGCDMQNVWAYTFD
jgi:hypothetical protein